MPIWPVDNHPFLPAGLTGEPLREHTELAERTLGLRDTAGAVLDLDPVADAEVIKDLKRYLALQVALQAAQDPEAFFMLSVGRGTETIDYRDGVLVHPVAWEGVQGLLLEYAGEEDQQAYPVIGGWREPPR